ncbi:IS200/IS605 family transposase [Hippea maritima]|uniref:Transposase IS200-family protein n=1 Tax=Hippea maritima (strain ATCC 700847 / DSM 10411 / MH2) TaxID=760142 RepID=F2LV57_HIPMA|nr:IS200/IS605 family transposase [Hippea maritima]AEA33641.1 transposase IS200-family protein [Hippea maritima DSM 10411]
MKRAHHHAKYDLKYHLVLVTKYRKKCITKDMLNRLEKIIRDICNRWDVELLEFSGEEDHIHLLISAHPSMELSKFTNNLKTVSSRLIRKEFKEHLSKFYWKPYFWTRAYFIATTGGAPLEVIKQYIKSQEKPEK